MANDFSEKVTLYTNILDQKVIQGPLTSDLNIDGELLGELSGAGQIKIANIAMQGLADHTRGGGFNKGKVSVTWETYQLEYDRDRQFDIDAMDSEEQIGEVTARAMSVFVDEMVVPEIDAIRFAKLAAAATSEGTATATTYSSASDALDAVMLAEEYIQDQGSALPNCILYCSPKMHTLLRKAAADSFQLRPGEAPNTTFQTFDTMRIVTVPGVRFYTAIDLLDGTSEGEVDGGYKKHAKGSESGDADGKDINFMVVNPFVAEAIVKHNPLRYFAPGVNQEDDAHKWQYRLYHDLIVRKNRANHIYLSAKA